MYRRKIDYMAKRLQVSDENELLALMDVKGYGEFNKDICNFLENPNKKTTVVLSMIPGGIFGQSYIDKFINSYEAKFENINRFCIERKMYPIFDNPSDIKASVQRRTDVLVPRPEEELNELFGVENFYEYEPPVYEYVSSTPETVNESKDGNTKTEGTPQPETEEPVPPQPGS